VGGPQGYLFVTKLLLARSSLAGVVAVYRMGQRTVPLTPRGVGDDVAPMTDGYSILIGLVAALGGAQPLPQVRPYRVVCFWPDF
jgi:hypothetical protein